MTIVENKFAYCSSFRWIDNISSPNRIEINKVLLELMISIGRLHASLHSLPNYQKQSIGIVMGAKRVLETSELGGM